MRKLAKYLGGTIMIAVFIYGFITYFITSPDPGTGQLHDGLGRQLSASPFFMRFLFGQERLWAGWLWFFIDMVVFWGGIAAGGALMSLDTE